MRLNPTSIIRLMISIFFSVGMICGCPWMPSLAQHSQILTFFGIFMVHLLALKS